MPIVFVHGVNTRTHSQFEALEPLLRRHVAPAISRDPAGVLIDDAFWGDLGANLAWSGASRPRTHLLGQGAESDGPSPIESAQHAVEFDDVLRKLPPALLIGDSDPLGSGQDDRTSPVQRLYDLSDDDLADLLASLSRQFDPEAASQRVGWIQAADDVAHDQTVRARLATCATVREEVTLLLSAIGLPAPGDGLSAMGGGDGLVDRLSEALGRARDTPAYALSLLAGELRPALTDRFSLFVGDIFVYLDKRDGTGGGPGPIQSVLLDALKQARASQLARGGEPIVVVSHSMGGQLVYDALTHFIPNSPDPAVAGIRVDFWCATASQVGFFEELKRFKASNSDDGPRHPVPFPAANLGVWWNVWDRNDVFSFTVRDIFSGADDEEYVSGLGLLSAHAGYFERPSFFRRFARKLEDASARGWSTP